MSQMLISPNLNIMIWSTGSSGSIWSMPSSSPSSSLGSSALPPSPWRTSSGGICWCLSCLVFVCRLMFWFSTRSHLACLEPLPPPSLLLLHLSQWLLIQPFLWKMFGWKEEVIFREKQDNNSLCPLLAGKINQVLKNSWTKHLSFTFNEKYNFGR